MTYFFAEDMDIGYCDSPKCKCVHFRMHFSGGHVGEAAVHIDLIPDFIEKIQGAAYVITTGSKPPEKQ